ncbi:hypothetical protein BACCAP_01156 [Pseudoflavonifractor capillosus ATCC 29799]|uniref:Uncharacterized protein n=1 Tax=Pseudoflavonifractor capillosus ATCC 29799 TaxID=411467 RepID=A6NSH7_9FIRM|nr:hypothetical protein BACCAP_01156 [Pseudoflavonifractor capillosus ATCC 29799]
MKLRNVLLLVIALLLLTASVFERRRCGWDRACQCGFDESVSLRDLRYGCSFVCDGLSQA